MIEKAKQSDSVLYSAVKPGFGPTDVSARFEWNLANNVEWFVCKISSRIAGWVNINWTGMKNDKSCPDIFDLYVIESMRSRGIGSRLIRFCEKRASQHGCTRIGLCVNPDENPRAVQLYKNLGYSMTGERYLDDIYDGHEDWVIDMKKNFGAPANTEDK
jgi:GNAT superfamily N-acetyltransferase